MQGASVDKKRGFLQQKGMTEAEIDEAFRRVPEGSAAPTLAAPTPSTRPPPPRPAPRPSPTPHPQAYTDTRPFPPPVTAPYPPGQHQLAIAKPSTPPMNWTYVRPLCIYFVLYYGFLWTARLPSKELTTSRIFVAAHNNCGSERVKLLATTR